MYERQETSPQLLQQHIRQMRESLELINLVLGQTPYQPGASWVDQLPLDDARAKAARALNANPGCSESFVCVYAAHVRTVAAQAKAATGLPPSGGVVPAAVTYPSIYDALSQVHPKLGGGQALQQELHQAVADLDDQMRMLSSAAKPNAEAAKMNQQTRAELVTRLSELQGKLSSEPSAADLADPQKAQIVKDAATATSVAIRLAMEASALATVIVLETRELSKSKKSWFSDAPDTAALLVELPGESRRTYEELQTTSQRLDELLSRLAKLEGVDPLDTAGYQFKEGLLDELVGFGWESVHFDLNAGGDMFFYSALSDPEFGTADDGTTFDYTGRFTRLEYDVEPIVLASVDLDVKIDWAHWAEAMGINLSYATNRVYKSGGEIESGSLARELGVSDSLSEAFDAALDVAGVRASVKIAHFTHGTVRDILIEDGTLLAEAPFQFDMKQIDVGYDLAPRHNPTIDTLSVGLRYFDYSLPRILYELQNATPGVEPADYVFSRETPPQAIRTQYYMLALTAGASRHVTPHFAPYVNVDFAFGYGPTDYYFLIDDQEADTADNREQFSSSGPGIGVAGALGFRWFIGAPSSMLNGYLDVYYHAQFLQGLLDSKDDGDTIVKVGTIDVFHGPTAALGLTF